MGQSKSFLVSAFILAGSIAVGQTSEPEVGGFPGIMGFKTLKCDFHVHTAFSDGEVSPVVRVKEA